MSKKACKTRRRHNNNNMTPAERREQYERRESRRRERSGISKSPQCDEGNKPRTINAIASGLASDTVGWYVLDTNLILSCVDVIPDLDDKNWRPPIDFKPNLDDALLIIPETVYDELDNIKKNKSDKAASIIASIAIKRLRKFFENSGATIRELMYLAKPVQTGWKSQTISKLKLHDNFHKILPWVPSANDNDGWIAATTLAASMIRDGLPVDGSYLADNGEFADLMDYHGRDDVILLTQDGHFHGKAPNYAVRTMEYSFMKPKPYTGCRDLIVPTEMFDMFCSDGELSLQDFKKFMPNELPLIANEYVILRPKDSLFMSGPRFVIARYHRGKAMLHPLHCAEREGEVSPNPGIETYYDALNDDSLRRVIVGGEAGTGKTFTAIRHGIKAVIAGKYARLVVVSSKSAKNELGALPGGEWKKMSPLMVACKDAIRSYLASTPEFITMREKLRRFGRRDEANDDFEDDYGKNGRAGKRNRVRHNSKDYRLLDYEDEYFAASDFGEEHSKKKRNRNKYNDDRNERSEQKFAPQDYNEKLEERTVYYMRKYVEFYLFEQIAGRSIEDAFIVVDETQRIKIDDARTIITRQAKWSKLIWCGDVRQIRDKTAYKVIYNGFNYARLKYFNSSSCANIFLTEDVRGLIGTSRENRDEAMIRMGII